MNHHNNYGITETDKKVILSHIVPVESIIIISTLSMDRMYVTFDTGVKLPIQHNVNYSNKRGVFVIKKYTVPFDSRTLHSNIIPYTINNVNNKDLSSKLVKAFEFKEYDDRQVSVETFISEEDLMSHIDIFLPKFKILISYNNTKALFPIPSDVSCDSETYKFVIYDSINPNRSYFIKIAGVVKEIVTRRGTLKDGLYIYFKLGETDKKVRFDLKDLNSCGVYKSRREAVTNGYLEEVLELYRQQTEIAYLIATVKTKEEMLKLGIVKAEAEADIKISLARQQQDIANRKLELENRKIDGQNVKEGFSLLGDITNLASKFF